jgi:hypothetical protein
MSYLLLMLRAVQWTILSVLNLLFGLVAAVFFNWWLPLVAVNIKSSDYLAAQWPTDLQRLPTFFRWFDTFDASLDAGWTDNYFTSGNTRSSTPPSYWVRKWYQVRWLYRNDAYGFAYWALGCDFQASTWKILSISKDAAGNLLHFIAVDDKGYWNVVYNWSWISVRLGWKALNLYDLSTDTWKTTPWGPVWRTQIVLSISR